MDFKRLALFMYYRIYTRIFPDYVREINKELYGCKSVLDLGCGDNSPLRHFPGKIHAEGVDAFPVSIEKSMTKGIHNNYHIMNVMDIDRKFGTDSFDCVIALDLIEHLSKEDGLKLLKKMETIARKKTIIFTPNGFLPQSAHGGNIWQIHKSGWTVKEMENMGYKVIGINGIKCLRSEFSRLKYRPKYFWWLISDITQVFVRNRPEKAYQILCTKEKR
jgi:SAM-dependent methyltransferase